MKRSAKLAVLGAQQQDAHDLALATALRPITRGDCLEERRRPCPWFGCRHHLAADLVDGLLRVIGSEAVLRVDATEAEQDTFVEAAFERMAKVGSCVLDLVDKRGEQTLQEIGDALEVTRERVRQIEGKVLRAMKLRVRGRFGHSFALEDAFAEPAGTQQPPW